MIRLPVFVGCLSLVVACGGGSEDDTPSPADAQAKADVPAETDATVPGRGGGGVLMGAEDACIAVSKLCDRYASCAPFLVSMLWGDAATCAARVKLACLDDAAAPGSGLTEAAISACGRAVANASCVDLFESRVEACEFRGTVANGATCGTNAQCASGVCKKALDRGCGTCVAAIAAGGACEVTDDCVAGLACSKERKCVMPAVAGAACDPDRLPCRANLFCRNGTCAMPGGAGDPCGGEGSCNLWQGFFCNEGAKTCQRAYTAGGGEACGLAGPRPTLCAAAGVCQPNALTGGVCQSAAADGEPCGAAMMGRPCLDPARCVAGRCVVPSSATCR